MADEQTLAAPVGAEWASARRRFLFPARELVFELRILKRAESREPRAERSET